MNRYFYILTLLLTFSFGQHFVPIWDNNPYYPMNIIVTSAVLDEIDLEAGDEIGIFDGDLCVGAAILENSIEAPNNTLTIIVSSENYESDGMDGFIEGNPIIYRYWDSSTNMEATQCIEY